MTEVKRNEVRCDAFVKVRALCSRVVVQCRASGGANNRSLEVQQWADCNCELFSL
jgi:hypothetical protein